MIKKKLYSFLNKIKIGFVLFLLLTNFSLSAQLLDSIAFDTVPIYNMEDALLLNPLKVYRLSLKKNKLSEVPEEIYQFKNLNSIDLSRNKLKKFPLKLIQFEYLQVLNLSSNGISEIPKEIGKLIHLKKIYFGSNDLSSIPTEIKYLKKLTHIDLWGNNIGSLPHEISDLKNTLEYIDMRVIQMSNEEHKAIKELLPETKIKFSRSCNCGF